MNDAILEQNKRNFIVHPFLFSIFPVLLLLAFNAHEISLLDSITPLVISFLLSFASWMILRRFLKSVKSGLILSWIILMILINGNVSNYLESETSYSISIFVLGPIFLIIGVLGIIFFVKTKANRELNSIFNVVAITISVILISLFLLYDSSQSFQNDETFNLQEISISVNNIQNKPDVFVFLLDEFAGEKQLEMDYDYSLKPFKSQLEERNFIFPDQSFTNYPNTIYSIPSLLNMGYVDDVIEKYQSGSKDIRASSPLFKHNNVMKIFKSYEYKVTTFANGYSEKFNVPGDSPFVDQKLCTSDSMIDHGILLALIDIYVPSTEGDGLNLMPMALEGLELHISQFDECIFSFIHNYKNDKEEPNFVFTWLMLPHGPYRYDSDGNSVNEIYSPHVINKDAYLNQLIFTEKKSLELIDSIQKQDPEAVIIIFSDHGSRHTITSWEEPTDEDLIRGFNNFSALYFPEKEIEIPEKLSLVNIFRIFFNEYFDMQYEILEDRHIWYEEKPFINKDVTNRLNSLT